MQNPLLLKFVAVFIASTILKVVFNMLIGGSIAMGLGVVVDVVFFGVCLRFAAQLPCAVA